MSTFSVLQCVRCKSKMAASVQDLLTDSQVEHIVERCVGPNWKQVSVALRPAVDGLAGFVGDHSRLTIDVQVDGALRTLKLFVKSVPRHNAAKRQFIQENGFFVKEMTVFKLIEEMDIGPDPCVAKALFYSDSVLVMPDLAADGYSIRNQLETFDLPHVLVTLNSVARFHAASANLETMKELEYNRPYSLLENYSQVVAETTFYDTPWLRTAAKLTANIIRLSKYKNLVPDLEASILKQFLAGCEDLTETDSLNVVLHKDLWVNNIMFKYEDGVPINSILVDFQCVRYGPPAFDIAMHLYLTTSRSFRQQNEDFVLRHYFKAFTDSLDADTRLRLKEYVYEEFLRWMEISRRFGMVAALGIFPFVLMDAATASKVFDDPQTYFELMYEDRTGAVLAHMSRCPEYGHRQLEVTEEFVERFLLP